jgi:hypothetical protein
MRRFSCRRRRPGLSSPCCSKRGTACALALVSLLLLDGAEPSALDSGAASPDLREWPRVSIANQLTYHSLRMALVGAADWLSKPACRGVFTEFRDESGSPLADRLPPLNVDEAGYLKLVLFRDGSEMPQCLADRTVMFTAQGHRVVFVCERQIERLRREDPARLRAMVIHEALHTLGLGENPPSSAFITERVLDRCAS